MNIQIGVVAAPHGAIVMVEHPTEGGYLIVGIETLPLGIAALGKRVGELVTERPDAQLVVDGKGIGSALWDVLVGDERIVRDELASRLTLPGDGAPQAWLYQGLGLDRQRLVNVLVTADAQEEVHAEGGLAHFEALHKALLSYDPNVREDGEFGSELVVALCLALLPRLPAAPRAVAFIA